MPRHTRPRVGLVGSGPWATRVHGPGIADHPDLELVSVWARRPPAAARLAAATGAGTADSFAALLPAVDAVAFAVPPAVQAPLALEAIRAGKHVILEKPVAPTVAEAERLVAAADETGVASLVVFTFRFDAATARWLDELHRLGGWHGGAARWLSGTLLDSEFAGSAWRHDGGALADIGPHVVDLLDAALGPITGVLGVHRSEPELWRVLFAHDGDRTSAATMSMHLPVEPSITDFSVYGAHGYREFDAAGSAADRYRGMLDEFAGMIGDGRHTHPCDVRRGLHVQRVLHAVATHPDR